MVSLPLNNNERRQDSDSTMSAANFYIPTLPGLPSDSTLTMYGGHIPSTPLPATTESAQRCSSFDGSLMEVGPLRLIPGSNGKLKILEGAWTEYANVLFIDQPVGTGYSYVNTHSYLHELPEAASQVVQFLSSFYKVFPEFSHHETYLAGESYAGQYLPYFASAILKTTLIPTKLKGIIIGNGWLDPLNQYPAYLDFALKSGLIKSGSKEETEIKKVVISCLEGLTKDGLDKIRIHNSDCEEILGLITDSTVQSVNGVNMCVNNYDVRLTDTHPSCGMNWPPDLADITPYLQRPEVKTAFHASRKSGGWVECNGNVGSNFHAITSKPSVELLGNLLNEIPILLFAGDQDLICNHVGIEKMIENLTWGGETGFGNTTVSEWFVDGKEAGTWTTARGLTYVKVASASHMVPYDQPLASHDMLLRFLGVDLLGAAGPAAKIPSRIGMEQEAVLGETNPDGSIITDTTNTIGGGGMNNGDMGGVGGSGKEDFGAGKGMGGIISTGNSNGNSPGSIGNGGGIGESNRIKEIKTEAIVNASSALFIIFLMFLAIGIYCLFKRRIIRTGSSSGGGSNGRRMSIVSGNGRGRRDEENRTGGGGEEEGEDPHELDQLVRGGDYRDDNNDRRVKEAEIFGLGDEDEEDDEEERKVKNG